MDWIAPPLPTANALASVAIALSALAWRTIPQRSAGPRLLVALALFAGLTVAVAAEVHSPLEPQFAAAGAGQRLWQQAIVSGWWLLAARLLLEFARLGLLRRAISREGRLFSDLLSGLVYVAVALTIASLVFRLPIGGLVATSGVIAIVLGLALQNTLADVFAGIAVGLERPFAIGDLVSLEGGIDGEVVQANWRSVQIRTGGNDLATIPNSVIAKSRIINRSVPSPVTADSVTVPVAGAIEPQAAIALIQRAILLCPEILELPAASVALARVGRRANRYAVGFSVARAGQLAAAKSRLLQEILRQLQGVDATGRPAVLVPDLAAVALFAALDAEARDRLRSRLIRHDLEPGQTLFAQGDSEASLFVVVAGVLEVTRTTDGKVGRIGRISAGDYIGEIGMLTGAPHAATVTALTPCTAYELRKEDVGQLLAEQPDVMRQFELATRRGQALIDRAVAASVGGVAVPPGDLLERIRAFFHGRR